MPTKSTRENHRAPRRFSARVALALVAGFAACNVYDPALVGSAFGSGGNGSGATGGSAAGNAGQNGGSAGTVPSAGGTSGVGGATGGASGVGGGAGGNGGAVANGGTGGMEGGSDGDGGEDPGVGGSAGIGGSAGAGGGIGGGAGASGAGAGGASGSSGGAGAGGAGAGGAGAGGAGAGGAGAGGAGAGGNAGTAGMGETCTGCARLSVPLTATGNKAHFTLLLPGATDLSAATVTFRVAKLAGTGGTFRGYIQEGSPDYALQDGAATNLSAIGASMQDIVWSVAGAGTAANKAMIRRIGIEINGANGSAWANPTVLYIDRIDIAGATPSVAAYSFDTSGAVYPTPVDQGPVGQLYLNSYSGDTNVTGAAISWLGP